MKIVKYIIIGVFTVLLACIPFISKSMPSSRNPYTYYRVYYDGELLGTIKSEEELLNYIDKNNQEYKDKYGITTVYKPNDLLIKSYKTYESIVDDTLDIYKKIENLASFTLKGYEFSIINGENTDIIYVLDEKVFNDAIETVIKTFVNEKDYEDYKKGNTSKASRIDNVYVKENINYKEVYIPINEKIYTDSVDLASHLLYGDEPNVKKYKVKLGDTIDSVALAICHAQNSRFKEEIKWTKQL